MITYARDYQLVAGSTDRPTRTTQEHEARPVVQVVVLPPPGAGDADASAVRAALTVVSDDHTDSLWDATWEDAEWR